MNQETAAKGQLIELRAKGWTYEKISRHTGIDKPKLLAWGIQYRDCIDAEKEIIRSALEEMHHRRAESLAAGSASGEAPDGAAQESYFHNLEGYPSEPHTHTRRPTSRRSKAKADRRVSPFKRSFRKFLSSPIVRAATRLVRRSFSEGGYAAFKR